LIKDVSFGIQAKICLEPLHPVFPTFNFSAGFSENIDLLFNQNLIQNILEIKEEFLILLIN